MAKPNFKRKTRSDKFSLTLHKTGQYCKKIRGKLYYFGTDEQQSLQRYLEQATFLHAGNYPSPNLPLRGCLSKLCVICT
jgi:YHS domain-containing protein